MAQSLPITTLHRAIALAIHSALLVACDPSAFGPAPPPNESGANPTSSVLVKPLVTPPPSDAGSRDAEAADPSLNRSDAAPPPPEPYAINQVLEPDIVRVGEVMGVVLTAFWRWQPPPEPPKSSNEKAKALLEEGAGRFEIWLASTGRMRAEIGSRAMPLARGTLLLGRIERYGHVLAWPDEQQYRVVPPGVLRSVLGDLRVDVTPSSRGKVEHNGEGELLGLRTRKVTLRSSYGSVELALAPIPEAGLAGPLLCRMLVEIASVDPRADACREGEVAVAATYRWFDSHGAATPGASFEVTELNRRTDLSSARFAIPPLGARYAGSGLPVAITGHFFRDVELADLRIEDAPPPSPRDDSAPNQGLRADNRSDKRMWLLVDGLPVATVAPWSQIDLVGLKNGRYTVQWRSFLGDQASQTSEHDLPARVVHGELAEEGDREARDAG